jgi:hypothetical protein
LDHGLHVLKTAIFSAEPCPKNQIKLRQPIERQDSMQTMIQTSRGLDSFLHEAAQNIEVFSNIQE